MHKTKLKTSWGGLFCPSERPFYLGMWLAEGVFCLAFAKGARSCSCFFFGRVLSSWKWVMLPLSGLIITWPLTETQIHVKCYLEMEKQLVLFCVLSTFTSCFEGVSQHVNFKQTFVHLAQISNFLIGSYLATLTYYTLTNLTLMILKIKLLVLGLCASSACPISEFLDYHWMNQEKCEPRLRWWWG